MENKAVSLSMYIYMEKAIAQKRFSEEEAQLKCDVFFFNDRLTVDEYNKLCQQIQEVYAPIVEIDDEEPDEESDELKDDHMI